MTPSENKFVLHTRCVDEHTDAHVERLAEMTDNGLSITSNTFFRKVDKEQISRELNYAFGRHQSGLRIEQDYHIQYFRSKWRGRPCYYLVWSAIEHVFVSPSDHRTLQDS